MAIKIKQISLRILGAILSISIIPCEVSALGFGDTFGVNGISVPGTEKKQEDSLLHTVQTAINRCLGILATVSLCLVIYAGFIMLTSGGDSKKYDSGLNIIKNAAIGLAIIAASWLIVSLVFYVINGSVKPNL